MKPGRTLTVCTATATPADDSSESIAVMTATLMTLIGTDCHHREQRNLGAREELGLPLHKYVDGD